MRNVRQSLAGLLFATFAATLAAEQRREVVLVRPPVSPIKFSSPWRPNGVGTETRVIGTVIDIRQMPVAHARVQLRDLKTGLVLASHDTNDLGEYAFNLVEPGTYVVEMILLDNYVIALSNAGALARYETLNTVVQLPGRWDPATRRVIATVNASSFFGMGSANSMTSSTLTMALDSEVRPTTAGEPVSPQ